MTGFIGSSSGYKVNGTTVVNSNGQVPYAQLTGVPSASTSAAGIVQLSSAVDSTSTTLAATASAVKAVNDTNLSLTGGTMTGDITFNPTSGNAGINISKGHLEIIPAAASNVGIGTTTPTSRLHVVAPASGIMLDAGGANATYGITRSGGAYVDLGLAANPGNYSSSALANDCVLRASGNLRLQSGTGVAAISISTSNNVGIGTTTPSEKLDVVGTVKSSGIVVDDESMFPPPELFAPGRADMSSSNNVFSYTTSNSDYGQGNYKIWASDSLVGETWQVNTVWDESNGAWHSSRQNAFNKGTDANPPSSIFVQFPVPVSLSKYQITCRYTGDAQGTQQAPQKWNLFGSADGGTTWVLLDSRSGVAWTNGQERTFDMQTSPGTYADFKVDFLRNNGQVYLSIGRLRMYANPQLHVTRMGNVGIGTTAPSEKLDVVGFLKSSSGFKVGSTTVVNSNGQVPYAQLTGVPSASTSAAGIVQLYSAVDSTSTTLAATASAVKAVNDSNLSLTGGTLTGALNISPVAIGKKLVLFGDTGSGSNFYGLAIDNSVLRYSVLSNTNNHVFAASNVELMRITGAGRVGIGTNAPAESLDVTGFVESTSGYKVNGTTVVNSNGQVPYAQLTGVPSASTSAAGIVQLSSAVNSTSTTLAATASAVKSAYDMAVTASNAAAAAAGSGVDSSKLPLTGGTLTGALQINSTLGVSGKLTATNGIDLTGGELRCHNSVLANGGQTAVSCGKAASSNNAANFRYTHVGNSNTTNYVGIGLWANDDLLNVVANGNVGIGTTSPQEKLHIESSAELNLRLRTSSASNVGLQLLRGPTSTYGGDVNNDWSIVNRGGHLAINTAWNTSNLDVVYIDTINASNPLVGIGTTSPTEKLDVVGFLKSSSGVKVGSTTVVNSNGQVPYAQLTGVPSASTSAAGIVQLSSAVDSTSTTLAATASSVKAVNDSNLSLSGGTLTGALNITPAATGKKLVLNGDTGSGSSNFYGLAIDSYVLRYSVGANTNNHVFAASNIELMRITGAGRVGIGTNAPAEALDVTGFVESTSGYKVNGTTVVNSSGQVPYAQLTGVPSASTSAAGIVQLSSAVDSTSTTLAATASAVKTVNDSNLSLTGGTMTGDITFNPTSGNAGINITKGHLEIMPAAASNVGIGTTAPTEKLDVVGFLKSSSGLKVGSTTVVNSSGQVPYAQLTGVPSASTSAAGIVQLSSAVDSTSNNLAATASAVKTVNDSKLPLTGGTLTGALNITTGNVGIGTTNPSSKLQVVAPSNGINLHAGAAHAAYGITRTGGAYVDLGLAGNAGNFSSSALSNDAILRASGNLHLQSDDGASAICISTSNNVGIGTASPLAKLHVDGNLRVDGNYIWPPNQNFSCTATANNQEFSVDLGGQNTYTGCYWNVWSDKSGLGSLLAVRGDTGYVGIGTIAPSYKLSVAGDVYATGDVVAFATTVSDRRLKSDIQPLTDALQKVGALSGCTFHMNGREDAARRDVGLIAQDVQTVLPEAVTETKEGYLTVAYGNLAGLFVEALKELKSETESLRSSKEFLKAEVDTLRSETESLTAEKQALETRLEDTKLQLEAETYVIRTQLVQLSTAFEEFKANCKQCPCS